MQPSGDIGGGEEAFERDVRAADQEDIQKIMELDSRRFYKGNCRSLAVDFIKYPKLLWAKYVQRSDEYKDFTAEHKDFTAAANVPVF